MFWMPCSCKMQHVTRKKRDSLSCTSRMNSLAFCWSHIFVEFLLNDLFILQLCSSISTLLVTDQRTRRKSAFKGSIRANWIYTSVRSSWRSFMQGKAGNEVAFFCKHEHWLVDLALPYNVITAAKTANLKVLTSVSVGVGVECVEDIDAFTIRFRKAYAHSWNFVVKAFLSGRT